MAAESKQATGTRTITAAEFKNKCLELLDEVAESGEELVITKNGPPGLAAGAVPQKAEELVRS